MSARKGPDGRVVQGRPAARADVVGGARGSPHRSRPARAALTTMVALLLVLTPASPSLANEEETGDGRLLVLQSISLIANRATSGTVAERIEDALMAPDTTGVDLDKVEQALGLVEGAPDSTQALAEARALLESAVNVRAATGYGEIPEPGMVGTGTAPYAAGTASGTTVVLDSLDPPLGISDTGDVVLLVLAAVFIVLGLDLARRWRPTHPMRELRRRRAS